MMKIGVFLKVGVLASVVLLLSACLGMPKSVEPVANFQIGRYVGQWYEIARLDHPFERGLSRITATYTPREDGGVTVVNRGYAVEDGEWKEAEGKAYFVEGADKGYLKVSFFGPFYGSYVVFDIDRENYEYAFVSGPDTSYLWLLARKPQVGDDVVNKFKQRASALGFDIRQLIFVDHSPSGS